MNKIGLIKVCNNYLFYERIDDDDDNNNNVKLKEYHINYLIGNIFKIFI